MRISLWQIIIALSLLFSCDRPQKDRAPKLRRVVYAKPKVAASFTARSFAGQARAKISAKLSFKVPGNLKYMDLKVGDIVNKGDVLAKLDPGDFNLQVEEGEAALLQTKAQSRHADANFARIRELYETKSVSLNELDAARATSESAKAQVEAMQKKLALIQRRLNYTVLEAPSRGQVAAVFVEKNENVREGQPIVTLNSISNLEVRVFIPENLIAKIGYNDEVDVCFDAYPGKKLRGRVTEVGIVSGAGNTFPVIIELSDVPEEILPGMSAEVTFRFNNDEHRDAVFLPSGAIVSKNGVNSVFVLIPQDRSSGIVKKRIVKLGKLTSEGFEIGEGLSGEELVITAGANSLSDGERVKL